MYKKLLYIALISLLFSTTAYAIESDYGTPASAQNKAVFESHFEEIMQPEKENFVSPADYIYNDGYTYTKVDPNSMPFFKQMRLRITNKLYERQIEAQKDEQSRIEGNAPSFWEKFKFNKKTDSKEIKQPADENLSIIENAANSEISNSNQPESMSLSAGINEQVTEKRAILDSDNVSYDDETREIIAIGRPILIIPQQETKIIADKMIYNEQSNILKCIDNVEVIKSQTKTYGDYLEVNLNEEIMLMDNISLNLPNLNMKAQKSLQKEELVIFENGNMHSMGECIYRLQSNLSTGRMDEWFLKPEDEELFFGKPSNLFKVNISNIYLEGLKNHDLIKAKNINIYNGNKKILHWPGLTMYTDKAHSFFEGNYPELGSIRKAGMFAGPGFAFRGPFGSVIKLIPFINHKSKFGVGGAIRYHSAHNFTDLGYASAANIFFVKGRQELDDNLFLQYAVNSYQNEWFLGARIPKYAAEIYYHRPFLNKDFLGKGKDLQFTHRLGFGLMKDDDKDYNGEHTGSSEISTTRARYMAEIFQTLYSYDNKKDFTAKAGIVLQGSASLYGTGATQFVARGGPRFDMQYKRWKQSLTYYLTGYSDQSPLPRYDAYRYGHQSLTIQEMFRINRYLSVGWFGHVTFSNDTLNNKLFQENSFLLSIGPDDLKVVIGYDFTRETTYFGINLAVDTKGTNVNYDKMVIKNPERLGKGGNAPEKEREVAFLQPTKQEPSLKNKTNAKPVLQYADVIEIDDPDKERID